MKQSQKLWLKQAHHEMRRDAILANKWPLFGKSPDECPSLDKACMEAYEKIMVAEANWIREEIRFLNRVI